MARRGVPPTDPSDPRAVGKALRAIEENFLELFRAVEVLEGQRTLVKLPNARRAPDNAPVPLGIGLTTNQDGSITVELTWSFIQGERPATQIVVVVKKGPAPLTIPVVWEDDVYTLPASATKTRLDLPSEHNYRFGVAAARGTPDGLAVGEVQSPIANPDWADVTGGKPILSILAQNICPNPDFETPNYFWVLSAPASGTVAYPTTDPKWGIRHAELVVTVSGIVQLRTTHPVLTEQKAIPVVGGKTYSFAMWVKRTAGTATADFQVVEWDAASVSLGITSVGTTTSASWAKIAGEIALNANTVFVSLRVGVNTGTGTFRFDGAQVSQCVLTQLPEFNDPQLDHNPNVPTLNLSQAWLGSRLLANAVAQGADVALTEATWIAVNSVTLVIFPEATTTKVLLSAAINLGLTVTTAGSFQFFWRWKRDTTVLYTSSQARFDSGIASTWAGHVASYMDSVSGGGTFVYSLELFKDDVGAANNAVSAKAGSQISVMPWSN